MADDDLEPARTALALLTALEEPTVPTRDAVMAMLLYDEDTVDRVHLVQTTVTLATWLALTLDRYAPGGTTGFVQAVVPSANRPK